MTTYNILFFRLKCLLWIPYYFILYFMKSYPLIIKEMKDWENTLPVKKCNNNILSFIHLMSELEEFRSLVSFRSGLAIPFKQKTYFFSKSEEVGEGLILQHAFSTVIFAEKIGKGCQIWHNVTIGRNGRNRCPRIGNNVKICANSVVVGDIEIGDNVIIGAGCVVTKNVPSNCTVVGNPARIVRKEGKRIDEKL